MNVQTYSVLKPRSLKDKTALRKRKAIYDVLSSLVDLKSIDNVLDVGVTADRDLLASNFFEVLFPSPGKITALSNQDASWMETVYPGLRFLQGDACDMNFADESFDLVFSSATLEHVGNWARQKQFISECVRVARRFVFLTTPNRWHPLEFHTTLPLFHWLPKNFHRKILRILGFGYLASEDNLNLLGRSDLSRACKECAIANYHIAHISFLALPSNLLLCIHKKSVSGRPEHVRPSI